MKVVFDTDRMEHLEDKSYYNHNYYKLPYSIDGCEIVYQEWEDDSFEGDYYLGNFNDKGVFAAKHLFWGDLNGNVDLMKNKQVIY